MPRHDPTPAAPDQAVLAWIRYKKLMGWMAVAAIAAVLLALLYVSGSDAGMSIHMAIATIAGVGLSVLIGTALMGLAYFSSHSGHDEGAHQSTTLTGTHDEEASRSDEYRD